MKKRSWTEKDLKIAVKSSGSYRQVLRKLGLVEAGGNYEQIKSAIKDHHLKIDHFHGQAWNKGMKIPRKPVYSMKEILKENSNFQSHKLKERLFSENIFQRKCMICGWNKKSSDGRVPVELDHINGNHKDNRLKNLRILCPNCHSLQPTHRGKNKGRNGSVA